MFGVIGVAEEKKSCMAVGVLHSFFMIPPLLATFCFSMVSSSLFVYSTLLYSTLLIAMFFY